MVPRRYNKRFPQIFKLPHSPNFFEAVGILTMILMVMDDNNLSKITFYSSPLCKSRRVQ